MGAYGWGLQGWDVSFLFQNRDQGGFSDALGGHEWDVTNPMILATMATVSRQVRRGDVREAPETHALNVHLPSLREGRMGFRGEAEQNWDEKTFATDKVPPEALAMVRVAVAFIDEFVETAEFDPEPFREDGTVVAATGQLRWTPAPAGEKHGGHVIVDTPATKAFIGFAPGGEAFDLGDGFAITPEAGFAVIYLTAKAPDATLADAAEIVVTAMARGRNTGMEFNEEANVVTSVGEAPIRLEPVRAEVRIPFAAKLQVLDQDGIAPKMERAADGSFAIDGAVDRTPFYRLVR